MNWDSLFKAAVSDFVRHHGDYPNRLYAGMSQRELLHNHTSQIPGGLRELKLLSGEKLGETCDCEYAGVKVVWVLRDNWFKFYKE